MRVEKSFVDDHCVNYIATTTAADFHNDTSYIRLIMGPVGTGKSVTCMQEILKIGICQEPGRDGIRRTRGFVVRNTYPELITTTLKTWKEWVPENIFGPIRMSFPISQIIRFEDVEIEVIFLALDGLSSIKKLRSAEATWIYINELQFMDEEIFTECITRVNRYPSGSSGAKITWTGIFADSNPPSTNHWIYDFFEKRKPDNAKLFRYQPALIKVDEQQKGVACVRSRSGSYYTPNTKADYYWVQNDNVNYWLKQVPTLLDEKINVIICGNYGSLYFGRPVHNTYNDIYHYSSRSLNYDPLLPIGFGWDFGTTPACAITQFNPIGQLAVLDELWSDDMNLRDFVSLIVIPHLDRHYAGWRINHDSRHDPAGEARPQNEGKSCSAILNEFGFRSVSAATNATQMRIDGLDYFLGKMAAGHPAFYLSDKCKRIREGLAGGYHFEKMKVGDSGESKLKPVPLKNLYSHICEALQYIAMHYADVNKNPRVSVGDASTIIDVPFWAS